MIAELRILAEQIDETRALILTVTGLYLGGAAVGVAIIVRQISRWGR